MPTEIVGARLQRFNTTGSLGVVTDTIYRQCFWPALDRPTALFAEGSSGIQVQGPPTPRNVIFPVDTVFLDRQPADGGAPQPTRGDCHFLVQREGKERYVAELDAEEVANLQQGKVTEQELQAVKIFRHIIDGRERAR